MNLCPNLNNKQVKKEFDELISVFGEDAAYYIWNLTNGEGLLNDTFKDFMAMSNDREYSLLASAIEAKSIGDETFMKAPNGEQSNLDKIQWIQVRTPQFKEWFGDWERVANNSLGNLKGNNDVSEIINNDGTINFDKLEEITNKYFKNVDSSLFKKGRKTLRERQEKHFDINGNPIEANTLEHLINVTKSTSEIEIKEELKPILVLAAALHDIAKPFHGGQHHGFQSVDVINSIFKGNISPLVKFAVRHHMLTLEESKEFTIDDAERIIQDAIDNNLNVQDAIDVLLALNTSDIMMGQKPSDIDRYTGKTKKETIEKEIPIKRELLELAAKNSSSNVSKVVDKNGEPLVVYHGSSNKFSIFDKNSKRRSSLTKILNKGFYFSSEHIAEQYSSSKEIQDFFKIQELRDCDFSILEIAEAFGANIYDDDSMNEIVEYIYSLENKALNFKENLYAVFLNIRNPIKYDLKGNVISRLSKEQRAAINSSEGAILYNVNETLSRYRGEIKVAGMYVGTDYIVFNPNQIKSADGNDGQFSLSTDNIYYNIQKQAYDDNKKLCERELKDNKLCHSRWNKLCATKKYSTSLELSHADILDICNRYGFLAIFKGNDVTLVDLQYSDELEPNISDIHDIQGAIDFMKIRFPSITCRWIPKSAIPEGVDKNSNAFVKNGIVYLISGKVTSDIVVEEFLHPLTMSLLENNPNLFDNILTEAKANFKKLLSLINSAYTEERGFSQQDRDNELVTQALSRYINMYRKSTSNKSIRNIVSRFMQWVSFNIQKALDRIGNFRFIDETKLPLLTLKELSDLISLNNSRFNPIISDKVAHSINPETEVSSLISKIFLNLHKAYEKLSNRSVRKEGIKNDTYETLNALKKERSVASVMIAVDYALKQLGIDDNGVPAGFDISDSSTYNRNVWSYLFYLSLKGSTIKDANGNDIVIPGSKFDGLDPSLIIDIYKNSIGFCNNLYNVISGFKEDIFKNLNITDDDGRPINDSRGGISSTKTGSAITKTQSIELSEKIKNLYLVIQSVESLWKEALFTISDKVLDECIDKYVTASTSLIAGMKENYRDFLHYNILQKDINKLQIMFSNYGQSSNGIVKLAFHLIQEVLTMTTEEAVKESNEILKAFLKANSLAKKYMNTAWQTVFMEKDNEGHFTGYFATPINRGQYEKELNLYIEKLKNEFDQKYGYHYELDDTGEIILITADGIIKGYANDELWGNTNDDKADEPTFIKYTKLVDKFKCEKSNRRYTYKYYSERLSRPTSGVPGDIKHGLSPKTLSKYELILSNINYYLGNCADDKGISRIENLSILDKLKLQQWKLKLEDLQNPFEPDGTIKTGEDLKTALEISSWLLFINELLVTKKLIQEFEKEYQDLINSGAPLDLINDFLYYNSSIAINSNYLELTIGNSARYSYEQDENSVYYTWLKFGAKNLTKDDLDFRITELEPYALNLGFWLNLKNIDQSVYDGRLVKDPQAVKLFNNAIRYNFIYDPVLYSFELRFLSGSVQNCYRLKNDSNTIIGIVNGKYYNYSTNTYVNKLDLLTYQEYLLNLYIQRSKSNDPKDFVVTYLDLEGVSNTIFLNKMTEDEIRNLFTYTTLSVDKNGNIFVENIPLSIFSKMLPNKHTFVNSKTGKTEHTITRVPKGRFTERTNDYANNEYINSLFDTTSNQSELPKKEYYNNSDEYLKITNNSEIKYLYDMLIEKMEKYKQMCLPRRTSFDYKLPQINANGSLLITRIKRRGFQLTKLDILDGFTSIQENDDDMRTNEIYVTNPDGTRTMDIVPRYLYDLKDPSMIHTDIAGAVQLFIFSALNYKNSKAILPVLEMFMHNLEKENRDTDKNRKFNANSSKNSLELYKLMLRYHLYDNKYDLEETSSKKEVLLKKSIRSLYRTGTALLLSGNLTAITTGYLDQITSVMQDMFVDKYFGPIDFIKSLVKSIAMIPHLLLNIGSALPNNKTQAIMQSLGISEPFDESRKLTAQTRISRIGRNVLMGGFRMLDYFGNFTLTYSILNNIKFQPELSDDDGNVLLKAGFYTRHNLIVNLQNAGYSHLEAVKKATSLRLLSRITLFDAYEFKNSTSSIGINPKYELYVTQLLKTQLRTTALQRSALMAGTNPENDVPGYKNTLIGGALMALRSFMSLRILHLLVGRDETSIRNINEKLNTDTKHGKIKTNKKYSVGSSTAQQSSERMAWNFETGAPNDEILSGLFRGITKVLKMIGNIIPFVSFGKQTLSYVEKNAFKELFAFVLVLEGFVQGWPIINDFAMGGDKPISYTEAEYVRKGATKNAELARNQSGTYAPWEQEFYDYKIGQLMLRTSYFRAYESKLAGFDPTTMTDILNSFSALSSAAKDLSSWFNIVGYELGLNDAGEDIIKNGKYKNFSKEERDLYKVIWPLDNLHSSLSYYGQVNTAKWYMNTHAAWYLKNVRGMDLSLTGDDNDKQTDKSKKKSKRKSKKNNLFEEDFGSLNMSEDFGVDF